MDTFDYDFSTAPPQEGELLPKGTLAKAVFTIRPGSMGPDGWLTQSKTSQALYIKGEFTICFGPYINRKVFSKIGIKGTKKGPSGEDIWGAMGKRQLRALLESARNINPKDESEQAINARKVNDYSDLQGLACVIKIGIEVDESGFNADRNKVASFITPDHQDYAALMAGTYVSPHNESVPVWNPY
jgi:hypothetical protein